MPLAEAAFPVQCTRFSPFKSNLIASGTAQNFGIMGNGMLCVYEISNNEMMKEIKSFSTTDSIFECAWSEVNENIIAVSCGDGSIKFWNITAPHNSPPVAQTVGHQKECSSIHWNCINKNQLASCGWDGNVIVWSTDTGQKQLSYQFPQTPLHKVSTHPTDASLLAVASSKGQAHILDQRKPPQQSTHSFQAHQGDALSLDWNKYNHHIIATSGADQSVRTWDVRRSVIPISALHAHTLAIRDVKFSPFKGDELAVCSYDLGVSVWDVVRNEPLRRFGHHSEFVISLDWSTFVPGLIASGSWDRTTVVWHYEQEVPLRHKRNVPSASRPKP